MMRNDNPFMPWNDGMDKYDPFKPWNNPMYHDDPFAPWNDPMADERDYERYCEQQHIARRD
jgi:hypothetical protein